MFDSSGVPPETAEIPIAASPDSVSPGSPPKHWPTAAAVLQHVVELEYTPVSLKSPSSRELKEMLKDMLDEYRNSIEDWPEEGAEHPDTKRYLAARSCIELYVAGLLARITTASERE
jgi:hypothetical protein